MVCHRLTSFSDIGRANSHGTSAGPLDHELRAMPWSIPPELLATAAAAPTSPVAQPTLRGYYLTLTLPPQSHSLPTFAPRYEWLRWWKITLPSRGSSTADFSNTLVLTFHQQAIDGLNEQSNALRFLQKHVCPGLAGRHLYRRCSKHHDRSQSAMGHLTRFLH